MLGWIRGLFHHIKTAEERDDLERIRGRLSTQVMDLSVATSNLQSVMETMIAERKKDAR